MERIYITRGFIRLTCVLFLSRVSHIRGAEAPVDAKSTRLDVSTVLVWCFRPGGFQTAAIFPSQDR